MFTHAWVNTQTVQYQVLRHAPRMAVRCIALAVALTTATVSNATSNEAPLADIHLLAGSCHDGPISRGQANPFPAMTTLARSYESKPTMIWLGDNLYFRPLELRFSALMAWRYQRVREDAPLQAFWPHAQHFATWDDHDYGADEAGADNPVKTEAAALFSEWWPNTGLVKPDASQRYGHVDIGDVSLFLLDNRSFRTLTANEASQRTVYGQAQLQWLLGALRASQARVKIVVSGGLMLGNSGPKEEGWDDAPTEREAFLAALRALPVKGLFFLVGDLHYSALTEFDDVLPQPVYQLACSPLSARPDPLPQGRWVNEPLRAYSGNGFCAMHVSGPAQKRVLSLEIRDTQGTVQGDWAIDINTQRPLVEL